MLKLFCLFARQYWERKSSPVRRHVIEALLRHPEIEGVVSGQGWEDYDDSQTLRANLDRLCPDPEVILYYKPYGNPKLGIPPVRSPDDVDALKVMRIQEAWWSKDKLHSELMYGNIDLALCTHENDLPRISDLGVEAVHLPQTAEASIFRCDRPLAERNTLCLLTGQTSEPHYPLRHRLKRLVNEAKIPGVIRNPPPSWADDLTANEQQVQSYARHLGLSRIALFCSSQHKYALGKVVEAMQAGCLVACDMPDDARFQRTLGRFILSLGESFGDGASYDDYLARRVRWALGRIEVMQSIASAGQRLALVEYSHERYVEAFLEACRIRLEKSAA